MAISQDYLLERSMPEPNSGCWLWLNRLDEDGYGHITIRDGQKTRGFFAHRVSYEVFRGPIAAGLHVHHKCFNRCCINPDHLAPVTPRENLMLSPTTRQAQNAAKTHCKRGHLLAGDNLYSYKQRICRTCHRMWAKRAAEERRAGRWARALGYS